MVAFKGMIFFNQELLVHIAKEPRENMMSYHIIKIKLLSKKIKCLFQHELFYFFNHKEQKKLRFNFAHSHTEDD